MSVSPKAGTGVFRHPGYVNFAASRVLSSISYQGVAVALAWMIYEKTNSAYALAMIGFCQFLPMVVFTFAVGHVADRFDRRKIGLVC